MALDMRCDIQDWVNALNLAKQYDPKQEPLINRKLASLIESQGNYHEAQRLYEKSFVKNSDFILTKEEMDAHNLLCYAGIAKTAIKLGDSQRGYTIAQEFQD